MSRLNTNQKAQLRQSDRKAVQVALSRVTRYFRYRRWLGNNNTYRQRQPGSTINQKHLSEYISVSAPIHCVDSWSFLGRALESLVYGDADIARHLGYYAELRAAMSLLAAEGIGVFNNRHGILDAAGNCQTLRGYGTHIFTWLALEYWAGLRRSTDLLAQIIKPGGVPLQEWLDAFGAGSTWRPIGRKWLRIWGLDLHRLSRDREARNEASYRPTHLNPRAYLAVLDSSEFLCSLWVVCEPSPPSRFELLDRHLLRLSLEQAFEAISGKSVKDKPAEFAQRIDNMLKIVNPGRLSADQWKQFLVRDIQPADAILTTEARRTGAVGEPGHHIQVIARATLLLRVATGACAFLLREAGLGREDLEFWWKSLGEERGLWEPSNEPDELLDLWADAETALMELREWETTEPKGSASYARWRRERAHAVSILGECERVALWGLGL